MKRAPDMAQSRTQRPRPKTLGALSSGLTVMGFVIIHDILISDIWFNFGRLVFSGALCGLVIVWRCTNTVPDHSPRRLSAYNGINVGLLVALGALSLLVLDPKVTMAESRRMDDAMARLVPPALPLMTAAILFGTFPRSRLWESSQTRSSETLGATRSARAIGALSSRSPRWPTNCALRWPLPRNISKVSSAESSSPIRNRSASLPTFTLENAPAAPRGSDIYR